MDEFYIIEKIIDNCLELLYNIAQERERKNKYFMKTEKDDVNLNIDEFYDAIITDAEAMKDYIARYDDIEKLNLYQYALRRAKALSANREENQEMISYCWLASMELEHTEAIQKYLKGEITQADIDAFEAEQEKLNEEILAMLEKKQTEKRNKYNPFVQVPRKLEKLKVVLIEKFSSKGKSK